MTISETILVILILIFLGFIVAPVTMRIFKFQIWEYVKERIEQDAKYEKMVRDMKKGKMENEKKDNGNRCRNKKNGI